MSSKELEYWRTYAEEKEKAFIEVDREYRDFQKSSHEFENELEEELAQSQVECDRLKSRLGKTEQALRKLREENERWKNKNDEQTQSLTAELKSIKEGTPAAAIARKLERMIQEKQHVEQKAAEDVTELREELEKALEKIEYLETELEELTDNHELEMDDIRAELRDAKLLAASGDGSGDNEKFMDIIESLKQELDAREDKIEMLVLDKDQLEARLLEESELNEELTGEVSDLTDDFMANSDKIEELEQLLKTTEDKNEEYIKELKKAEDKIADLELESVALAAQSPSKKSSKSKGAAAADPKVKAKLSAAEKRINELEELLKNLENQLKAQETLNEQVTKESSDLSNKNLNMNSEINTLNEQIEDYKSQIEELQTQVSDLEDNMNEAKESIKKAEDRANEADERVNEIESTMKLQATSGQSNLQEVQRKCDILQSQVTKLQISENELKTALEEETQFRQQMEAREKRERELKAQLRNEKASVQNKKLQQLSNKGGAIGNAVSSTTNALGSVRACMNGLAGQVDENSAYIVRGFGSLTKTFKKLGILLKSAEDNYKKELKKRMSLFDDLQDVRGNIKVYCRVRPFLPFEEGKVKDVVEYPGHNQIAIKDEDSRIGSKTFTFDRVYTPLIDQSEVFNDVRNLVESVLDGYPVCIFAYGQTGSGKTYTMEGPPSNRGISFRALDAIFTKIRALSPQWVYKVSVSLLEVYNERLRDLLDSDAVANFHLEDDGTAEENAGKLQIRKGPHGHYVTNLKKYVVRSAEEVLEVMALGNKNRSVGSTSANEHSSRSHSILGVTVEGVDQVTQNKVYGRLSLIDLAGSERIKNTESTGQRLVEATYINKSLSALGDVMTALSNPKKGQHIPFRNSKLTFLLQDSLGGNSKTMMFVNMNAGDKAAQETVCSLQFATRVRKVRLSANAQVENSALNVYREKVETLKDERKNLQQMLEKQKSRYEDKISEKENHMKELNHKIKRFNQKMTEFEMQKKKEISDIQSQFSKMQRMASSSSAKSAEDKLQRKLDSLNDRYEQAQKLLKLSQRENKHLKEVAARSADAVKDKYKEERTKARALEQKLEKMKKEKQRRDSKATSELDALEWKRKAESHEQLLKVLRDKNKKLMHDMQKMKTSEKRAQVKKFKEAQVRVKAQSRFATDSGTSKNARVLKKLNDLQESERFVSESTRLTKPREWSTSSSLEKLQKVMSPKNKKKVNETISTSANSPKKIRKRKVIRK